MNKRRGQEPESAESSLSHCNNSMDGAAISDGRTAAENSRQRFGRLGSRADAGGASGFPGTGSEPDRDQDGAGEGQGDGRRFQGVIFSFKTTAASRKTKMVLS